MFRLITVLLAAAVLVLVAACGDDDGDGKTSSTPTVPSATEAPPSETATPPAEGETSGADGFREFIPTFQEAIDLGDATFLRDRALTEPIVCTADDVDPNGAGGPACEFEGQEFDGFIETYWRSEGAIIPVEDAFSAYDTMLGTALPQQSDDFGDGAVQVYALNIEDGAFDAIVTAIIERPADFAGEGPLRVSYETSWAFEDGRWGVTRTLTAFVLGEEFLQPADEVLTIFPNWERYEGP